MPAIDPRFDGAIFQTPETGPISGAVWGGHLDFPRIVPEPRRGLGPSEIFVVGRDAADLIAREASLAVRRLGASVPSRRRDDRVGARQRAAQGR